MGAGTHAYQTTQGGNPWESINSRSPPRAGQTGLRAVWELALVPSSLGGQDSAEAGRKTHPNLCLSPGPSASAE